VYGTLAVDGVFDGVMELSDDEYSVERADRYVRDAGFPSVMYRHSDISTSGLINSSVCLSDVLHQQRTAQQASRLRQQPFYTSQEQVRLLDRRGVFCFVEQNAFRPFKVIQGR